MRNAKNREHPILFKDHHIPLILAKIKTQTRRIILPQPRVWTDAGHVTRIEFYKRNGDVRYAFPVKDLKDREAQVVENISPYGVKGSVMWPRYPLWTFHPKRADNRQAWIPCLHPQAWDPWTRTIRWPNGQTVKDVKPVLNFGPWKQTSSLRFPRWAAHILLSISSIRIERLQDITEEEAKAEGAPSVIREETDAGFIPRAITHKRGFMYIWDNINRKRGFDWSSNPWVFAIRFRMLGPKYISPDAKDRIARFLKDRRISEKEART